MGQGGGGLSEAQSVVGPRTVRWEIKSRYRYRMLVVPGWHWYPAAAQFSCRNIPVGGLVFGLGSETMYTDASNITSDIRSYIQLGPRA